MGRLARITRVSRLSQRSRLSRVVRLVRGWAFYTALSHKGALDDAGDGVGGSSAWGAGAALSDWRGVAVTGGRVTAVAASDASLAGPLAAGLGDLGALVRLELWGNDLSGPIPAELGALEALEVLSLSGNDLSGPIPAELGDLGALEVLSLSGNDLSGPIPAGLGALGELRVLSVLGNDLSGEIPAALGALGRLERLELSGNDLSGEIPAALGDLGELRVLLLLQNSLSGPIPAELAELDSLQALDLSANDFSGLIPAALGDMASLRSLDLGRNPLLWPPPQNLAEPREGLAVTLPAAGWWVPPAPTEVTAAPHPQGLAVTWSHPGAGESFVVDRYDVAHKPSGTETVSVVSVDNDTPTTQGGTQGAPSAQAVLSGLRRGVSYEIEVTAVNSRGTSPPSQTITAAAGPAAVCAAETATSAALGKDCRALWAFRQALSDTGALGAWSADTPLARWRGVTVTAGRVTALAAPAAGLAGPLSAELGELDALVRLDLTDNALTGPIPAAFGSLSALERLDLADNALSGPIPAALGGLAALVSLDLRGNALSGPVPAALGSLTKLEDLRLEAGSPGGPIPAALGSLKQLEVLWLSGAGVSGPIPAALGNLAKLRRLHIHSDALTGPIPAALGRLGALESLYLSGKAITGEIPHQLSALRNLRTLWLKSDNLYGIIASWLIRPLRRLETLHISGGQISGTITAEIGNLPELRRLYLHDNILYENVPASIADHPKLTTLWLSDNRMSGTLPAALGAAAALKTIDLRGNHFTWPPPNNLTEPRDGLTVLLAPQSEWARPAGASAPSTDYTRAQFAVSFANELWDRIDEHKIMPTPSPSGDPPPFSDVPASPASAAGAVAFLYEHEIIKGCTRTTFCADKTLTRAHLAVMFDRAYNLRAARVPELSASFTDMPQNYWAEEAINRLYEAAITKGCHGRTPKFCPDRTLTKWEANQFISRAADTPIRQDILDDYPDHLRPGGGTTTTTTRAPKAPTVTVTPGPGSLTVTWEPHTDDKTGIRIDKWEIYVYERAPSQGCDTPAARTASRTTIPADGVPFTGLKFLTKYIVHVRGVSGTHDGTCLTLDPTTTQPAEAKLAALEITQGLQNWKRDIKLVKGKTTVIRAFIEPTGTGTLEVTPKLSLVSAGSGDPDPKTPINGRDSDNALYDAKPDASNRRNELDVSANFLIGRDETQWIGDPDTTGAITRIYRLTAGKTLDCSGAALANTDCYFAVTFTHVDTPEVVAKRVKQTIDGTDHIPKYDDAVEQMDRIESLMPIPKLDARIEQLQVYETVRTSTRGGRKEVHVPDPTLAAVLNALEDARGTDTRPYLGMLKQYPKDEPDEPGGLGNDATRVAAWYMFHRAGKRQGGYARNLGSHEFGHVLGMRHAAYKSGDEFYTIDCKVGETGDEADREDIHADEVYPYAHPSTDEPERALLGKNHRLGDSSAEEVWGLDTRFVDSPAKTGELVVVVDPGEVNSVMSYCQTASDDTQSLWIDQHYHPKLITAVNGYVWPSEAAAASEAAPQGASSGRREVLVVSGVRTEASNGTVHVTMWPLYGYQTAEAVPKPSGSGYRLELLDSDATVLRSVSFGAHTPVAQPGKASSREWWRVRVADPPQWRSIRIWRGSQTIAELEASTAAPVIAITAPTAAQAHTGESVRMSWTASDADGDVLSYLVYYSTDAGSSWRLLSAGQTEPSLAWPRADLAGSDTARIRVIATDGLRSAAAESAVFSVAKNPPQVHIRSPAQGRVYGGHAAVILDAAAHDAEDGQLDSSKISWRSSIDGQIATGAYAVIATDDLTAGTHTITATATDSHNTAGSASVTVSVRATNDAPGAMNDLLRAVAGRSVDLAVLANDADTEGDIFTHTLAVVVPAGLGEAGRGGRSGTVGYKSAAAGYDVFEYVVCDQHRQCGTARTVVVVEAAQ